MSKRKQLLSNSEEGFCNDNLLLGMLLGRPFLQLLVIRCSDCIWELSGVVYVVHLSHLC